jgi:hypothetical protein
MNVDRQLDHILNQYFLACEQGDRGVLARLIAEYPAYEHQLTAYALLDASIPTQPDPLDLVTAQSALTPALKARALSSAFAHPISAPIAGIVTQAAAVGLSARALAAAANLPRDLVLQLDKRLIAPRSIPRLCLRRLAGALQTSVEAVDEFLSGGPARRVAAFNFASAAPVSGEQSSFADALAQSALATAEQRTEWEAVLREDGLLP